MQSEPQVSAPVCDCAGDPIGCLVTMFVDLVQGGRIRKGQSPAMRPVFLKPHGVARGVFRVAPDLPDNLRVGVFAGGSYPAWVRFSSDTLPTRPDLKTTVGIGIKLFDVPGPKLLEPDARTHDFVVQNHDVFFVDTAAAMCEFTKAGVIDGDYGPYLDAHPTTKAILADMQKVVDSVLGVDYWSVLPFAFGADRNAKYKLSPSETDAPGPANEAAVEADDPDYLHADLRRRLLAGPASFDFFVQFQTDPATMPLDAATVRWDESASPPVRVATLVLDQQDVDARGQPEYGENLSFSTWHALAEHAPVGSIADARRAVYQASARQRRNTNGVPVGEPQEARPLMPDTAAVDTTIVRAAIHPSIGIARVGDSVEEFFLGPERIDEPPQPPGFYKDATGALKRQAARFRVYGYNAAGEVVAELTPDNAEIAWTVHVANTKAAWYEFQLALDIPDASDPTLPPSKLRNGNVLKGDRHKLRIDPGPRTIEGRNTSGPEYAFDTGEFWGTPVYIGELRTDEDGRLVFLGGRGVSASYTGAPATTFANNDTWHDDVSDGPVTATVSIDGRAIPVDPAWVVTAPPNYAPDVVGVRTMYDLIYDAMVTSGIIEFPPVSFDEHIAPILLRLCGLQWVNAGFAAGYGWGGREHFLDPADWGRLSSNAVRNQEYRRQVLNTFRLMDRDGVSPVPWPWLYGDAMNIPAVSPRQMVSLSPTQMRFLDKWAAGDFDPPGVGIPVDPTAPLPLAEQPAMLDRAALTYCLADAFHPGCEMTWPMRHASMFMSPFRIRHRPAGMPEPDYGIELTPDEAVEADGPLYAQGPGDISRWMAVPWQTDTASCRSGYEAMSDPRFDPYLPTFWPARVPNQVLSEQDYEVVMDTSLSLDERLDAFAHRSVWWRFLTGTYQQQINTMIDSFGKMGVVEMRDGPGDADFPAKIGVESQVGFLEKHAPPLRNLLFQHVEEGAHPDYGEQAVAAAISAAPVPDEQITAGYIEKVRRFRR